MTSHLSNHIEFIKQNHPFDCLTSAELKQIEQTVKIIEFKQGTHILDQGGPVNNYLHMIYEGAVRLVRDGQVFQVLEEGELFAYLSLINKTSPSFDVVAEEDVVICQIPEDVFHELVNNADFAEFFLKSIGERLRKAFSVEASSPLADQLTAPVDTLISHTPAFVTPTDTVTQAAQAMRQAKADSALVMAEPMGIVTDRDFLFRLLAQGLGPDTPIQQVMSQPVKTLSTETPVHGALLFMLEEDIHHLPLTYEGEVVGVVTAADLLRHQARSPLYLTRQLENMETSDVLNRYGVEITGTVETMFEGGLDVAQIGRVIASLNDTLLRNLLRLAEKALGPPPTPYAWLVFGSEGRMEQALLTDQDNALVYQTDSPAAQRYFKALAERVIDGLIQAGFPPCPGGYMATNWCYPLNKWGQMFKQWVNIPDPQSLLETTIFFDFRAIYGELSTDVLAQIVLDAGDQKVFLAHMARAALEFKPPLGFFSRIRSEDGLVDLKMGGVAPIVG